MKNCALTTFTLLCLMATATISLGDTIYKCTDKNGNVRYSDLPCKADETSALFVQDSPGGSPGVTDDEPERTSPQPIRRPKKIKSGSQEHPVIRPKSVKSPGKNLSARLETVTLQGLMNKIRGANIYVVLSAFIIPPLLVLLVGAIHREGAGGKLPWNYFYSFVVYLVCIPGIFACVITSYTVLFLRQSLLHANVFVYFFPILTMIITLVLVSHKVSWNQIPGVDRLSALMTILFISFGVALAIQKTRIWIVFGGSVKILLVIFLVCFILLKLSMNRLVRRKP